jgi:hypothetical protein
MMHRQLLVAALGLCLIATHATAADPPNNGYIGVFADEQATDCCFSTNAEGTERMHVFAVTAGAGSDGISGAEFRISVEPPAPGATFLWIPDKDLSVSIGDPVDNGNGGGALVSFVSCQSENGLAGDKIKIGEIYARNLFGEHRLVVRPADDLTNAQFACPSIMLCDGPVFTQACLTLKEGDSALRGEEPAAFVSAVNSSDCAGTSCGFVATEAQTWTAIQDLYR